MSSQTAEATAPPVPDKGKRIENPVLHHVGFTVAESEYETMIDWYRQMLNLSINYQGRWEETRMTFLVNDDANHRVVFITNPALTPEEMGPHTRLGHTAYEFPSIGGLLTKYAELRDKGIQPYMSIDHGLCMSIYYMDPCGFGIELQVDAFDDWSKSSRFMHESKKFLANPVGILFNADMAILDLEDGADVHEIHRKAYEEGAYPPTAEQRQRLAIQGVPLKNMWDHESWSDDHPTFAGL
jgi:catechol 2,3-dioxygenase